MNVLLTNDDGIDAAGLRALYEALRVRHTVWVFAPAHDRSGTSNALSLGRDMLLEEREKGWWALSGTPTDCVICALKSGLLPKRPDVVVSGINGGCNIGTDVVYSGTCGAARQASLSGIPGIALSVLEAPDSAKAEADSSGRMNEKPMRFQFEPLAAFAARNLEQLRDICGKPVEGGPVPYFANVNAPPEAPYAGLSFAPLSCRLYSNAVSRGTSENGISRLRLEGEGCAIMALEDGFTDASCVGSGRISISLVFAEPACAVPGSGTGRFVLDGAASASG